MDDDWFAPKQFGYGAGWPIAWQGWALLGGYLAAVIGTQRLLRDDHPAVFLATVTVATVLLIVLCARHTRGGWRWRWGGD